MAIAFSEPPRAEVPEERRLWLVRKDTREAEARVRRLGAYVELRVLAVGEVRLTRLFPAGRMQELREVADAMQAEFIARGWQAVPDE